MTNFRMRCGNGPFKVRLMRQLEKRCGNAARRVPMKYEGPCVNIQEAASATICDHLLMVGMLQSILVNFKNSDINNLLLDHDIVCFPNNSYTLC